MKKHIALVAAAIATVMMVPTLRADVKTREKVAFKLEGVLGGMGRLFGGSAAKDGITTTMALKGQRRMMLSDTNGDIVDMTEQKVYRIDVKKKEYKVLTFAEVRKEWQDAQAEMKKNADELAKAQGEVDDSPKKEYEFTADIKETGQTKSIAGYNTREVILTITGKEKTKTLEEGGGVVMTTTMWLAPKIAALDELTQFELSYWKAIAGDEDATAIQQLAMAMAMFPAMQPAMEKMREEGHKLAGTALVSTMVFENVKSAAQVKAASSDQGSSGSSGGGGISGRLAGRLMGNRGGGPGGASTPRTTVFSTTRELLSVDTSATAEDVAIPAGFKEKK